MKTTMQKAVAGTVLTLTFLVSVVSLVLLLEGPGGQAPGATRDVAVPPRTAVKEARRTPISTRHLAPLPGIEELRRLCQSLAMLDAIICPQWADRFHSFDCKWAKNMMLASWRNGSGDEYYLLFCEQGAIMKGFAHESYMSPYQHGNKVWDGVLSEVPAEFGYLLKEPAFEIKATTFCVWRLKKDSAWHTGKVIFPDKDLLRTKGSIRYDPDGSQSMMALFDRDPKSYKKHVDDIYGERVPPKGYDLKTISAIYAHEPLSEELVAALNPKLALRDLKKDLADIGYPVSKERAPGKAIPENEPQKGQLRLKLDEQPVAAAKKRLRKQIEEAGLARLADDLEKLMRFSIRLKAKVAPEVDRRLGSSKLGGTPDLPESTAWPECNGVPMALLAQLRLQDMVPYDPDGRLPKSGMLHFFYEAKEQSWGGDPKDRGQWKVIYYDGDLGRLRTTTPPDRLPKESRFRACTLVLSNEFTLPPSPWDSKAMKQLKMSDKEEDRYIELLDEIISEGANAQGHIPIHRMFGHPDQIQGDMRFACQRGFHGVGDDTDAGRAALEKGADDWQLLLQIDSDERNLGTMWCDVGRIYFWIRQQDLRKRDFSNVWLVLQSS
jgi:uncharacterized protein YwqG